MPCWEIRTMTVEFKAKNKTILLEALKNLNLFAQEDRTGDLIFVESSDVIIDLKNQKVECRKSAFSLVNKIKVEYSKIAIFKAAKLRKWAVRMQQDKNKFQLVRS
jgi:hypothetical protein